MTRPTDFPEPLDVIAVGAHPDDVEIGCGGTLARLVEQGHRVGIIDLTDGEPTPLSPGPEVRLAEAKAAADTLGIHQRITLDLPNRKLFDSYEARMLLAAEFRRYRPKLVLSLGDRTSLASPDHWQAMQITDAAVFYSRLTKWDDQFDGLPVHAISTQLYFKLAFEPMITAHSPGSFVMDITQTLEKKLASVRCYASQFPPAKAHVFDRVRGAALQCGSLAGYTAGEMFVCTRSIGTPDMMQLLFPRWQAFVEKQ